MKKKLMIIAIFTTIASTFYGNPEIIKYEIKERETDLIKTSSTNFEKGIPTGFGSGIFFKEKDKSGNLYFYVISDRGPNGDGPLYDDSITKSSSKFFPSPQFTPTVAIVKVDKNTATVNDTIEIKVGDKKISGLPIPKGMTGATNEIALDENLNILGYDSNGLDTEAIVVDSKKNFWISDEYGPFIVNVDSKTGKIIKKLEPGKELPEIIKYRQPNRGMEGLAIDSNDKLYGIIQSTLDINNETANTAQFLRFIEVDPNTGKSKMYAYPHDIKDYKKSKDAKIGDLASIGNNKFLVIEQGTMANKKMKNMIYLLDTTNATDITNITKYSKPLEYAKDISDIQTIKKVPFLDLREYGWEEEKAEGLAIIDDFTIAITSDNDFGIGMDVINGDKSKLTEYIVSSDKKVTLNGQPVNVSFRAFPTENKSKLWIIKFPEPIKNYFK